MLTIIGSFVILISIFLPWIKIIFVPIKGINLFGGTFATSESSIAVLILVFSAVSGIYKETSKLFRVKNIWTLDVVLGSTVIITWTYLRCSYSVDGAGPALCIAGGILFMTEGLMKMTRPKVAQQISVEHNIASGPDRE